MNYEPTPECRLFQSVILQAVRDAESATSKRKRASGDNEPFGARRAREWLIECGDEFRFICALAGWDADFISEAFRDGRLSADRIEDARPENVRRRKSAMMEAAE